jgi:phosphonate metabolism protein PhnN/1,5-bisphosphokinase (PRPP-forming)
VANAGQPALSLEPPAKAGPGIFVAVAGPSGAGKDSLIAAARERLAADGRIVFVQRVITRPEDGHEPHAPATPLAFRLRAAEGGFALHWSANGLHYGLPAELLHDIAAGRVVVANVSRDIAPDVRARFARSLIVHVTASPATLAQRLAARGREDAADMAGRLARALLKDQGLEADVRIENDGALADSAERFVHILLALLPRP